MINTYMIIHIHLYIYICNYLKQLFYLNTDPAQSSRLMALLALFIQLMCIAKAIAGKGSPWGPPLA